MKVAISLPDDLCSRVDRAARRLGRSRSALLADAAREYLARHEDHDDATESWNRAIEEAGQPGDDPAARAFRGRTKAVVRRTRRTPR
jgi:metal-responsive CopG/Arc/MetJ family transcriptional regulator